MVSLGTQREPMIVASTKLLVATLVEVSKKFHLLEILLDVLLISFAYWSAYAIKFGPASDSPEWRLFLRTLPVLVVVRLVMFLFFGVYRISSRYASDDDVVVYAKTVAAGSVVSMLIILFKFRFQGFSRAVFIVDALLMLMMLIGSRMVFAPSFDGCR